MSARRLAVALLALALALPAVAVGAAPRTTLPDIENEVMCPICGTALGLSQSPQAERERVFIQKLIDRGRTKAQIKDALVAEYGPEVLAVPETRGFDLAAWIVPGVGFVMAIGALSVGLRRWRGRGSQPAPPKLAAADSERLDADIAKYDL